MNTSDAISLVALVGSAVALVGTFRAYVRDARLSFAQRRANVSLLLNRAEISVSRTIVTCEQLKALPIVDAEAVAMIDSVAADSQSILKILNEKIDAVARFQPGGNERESLLIDQEAFAQQVIERSEVSLSSVRELLERHRGSTRAAA